MSDRNKPFIVASKKAFGALPHWLRERGCNTYSHSYSADEPIQVGYDTKPDSDWGGKYDNRGRIIVRDPELFDETCKVIERAYGWPERESHD